MIDTSRMRWDNVHSLSLVLFTVTYENVECTPKGCRRETFHPERRCDLKVRVIIDAISVVDRLIGDLEALATCRELPIETME